MTSFATSAASLTSIKLSDISMNISELAIVACLYPQPLFLRLLTSTHIAAIKINTYHTYHTDSSSSVEHINSGTIANDTIKMICLARAYGDYYQNLSIAQHRERTIYDNYKMLG